MEVDLFGNEIVKDILLRDKYVEPPFTRLDAVSGQLPTPQDIQWKARQLTNTAFNEWWEKQVGNLR